MVAVDTDLRWDAIWSSHDSDDNAEVQLRRIASLEILS